MDVPNVASQEVIKGLVKIPCPVGRSAEILHANHITGQEPAARPATVPLILPSRTPGLRVFLRLRPYGNDEKSPNQRPSLLSRRRNHHLWKDRKEKRITYGREFKATRPVSTDVTLHCLPPADSAGGTAPKGSNVW